MPLVPPAPIVAPEAPPSEGGRELAPLAADEGSRVAIAVGGGRREQAGPLLESAQEVLDRAVALLRRPVEVHEVGGAVR